MNTELQEDDYARRFTYLIPRSIVRCESKSLRELSSIGRQPTPIQYWWKKIESKDIIEADLEMSLYFSHVSWTVITGEKKKSAQTFSLYFLVLTHYIKEVWKNFYKRGIMKKNKERMPPMGKLQFFTL